MGLINNDRALRLDTMMRADISEHDEAVRHVRHVRPRVQTRVGVMEVVAQDTWHKAPGGR